MAIKLSVGLRNALLNASGLKESLDGGFLYVYAGTPPTDADAALDMGATHTEVVKISVDGDGSTGLTFAAPANGVLNKTSAENWTGTINFDGADSASSSLTPAFFRFCAAGDNGRGAGTASTKRIQGSAGGPSSGADLDVGAEALVDNGANTVTINTGRFILPAG